MDDRAAVADAALRAARAALYRRGATSADRDRYRAMASAVARAAPEPPPAVPRVHRTAIRVAVAVAGAAVLAAGVVGVVTQTRSAAPEPSPMVETSSDALDLGRVPAGWRLSSLVSRGDGLRTGSTLSLFRSVTGGEFLLVLSCPSADGRFEAVLADEDGPVGEPLSGRCGRQVAVPLALERGVGRVRVRLTTTRDLPFAAAVVRRGSGAG